MTNNTDPVRALDYTPGRLDETAPERIWLQIDTAGNNADRDLPFPDADGVTWEQDSVGGLEIQYVRADLASAPPSAPVGVEGFEQWYARVDARFWNNWDACNAAFHAGSKAALAQQPAAPVLAKRQPCGCVICTCEDEQQCQGCGAKHCGNRADHPPYVAQQPAAPSVEAVAPADGIIEQLEGERDRCNNLAVNARNSLTRSREARLAGSFDWAVREIRRLAAPQQPVGVDEAMVEGLKQLVRHLAGNPNFDFDAALADLAAQQQGGRADDR